MTKIDNPSLSISDYIRVKLYNDSRDEKKQSECNTSLLYVLVSAVDRHLAAGQGTSKPQQYEHDGDYRSHKSNKFISTSDDSSGSCSGPTKSNDALEIKLKPFQIEQWNLRYRELIEFVKERGHADVPQIFPQNPKLARWVKRQRVQNKLRSMGRPSTMTAERIGLLDSIGFVWDSYDVRWHEKKDALLHFRKKYGHCDVPVKCGESNLGVWVKCQRRQYKLFKAGKPSSICQKRILELDKIGFKWEIRSPRKTIENEPDEIPFISVV